MKKRILILGASRYQLPAISTAKEAGYEVLVADNVPDNPGHRLADKSFIASTTDAQTILRIAETESIQGVLAFATDVAVPTAAFVADSLKLPGPPIRAAETLCSKINFRRFLTDRTIPAPQFEVLSPKATSLPRVDWRATWLIKPDRSSGSKGIFVVRSEEELRSRLSESFSFSENGLAILERFIDGSQGTCEGTLDGGRVSLMVVTERETAPPPYVATSGHTIPSRLSAGLRSRLRAALDAVFGNLGVISGPFDCDFVATDSEIYLLEVTPRVGGNSLSKLIRVAYDFDIVRYSVDAACGRVMTSAHSEEPQDFWALRILGASAPGLLHYNQQSLSALEELPWLKELALDVEVGTKVERFANGRHRLGEYLVTGRTREELMTRVEYVKQALGMTTREHVSR